MPVFTVQRFYLIVLLFVGLSSLVKGQTFSPDITVAIDGSGDFISLQAAIDAVPDNSSEETIIYIKRGTYTAEKLIVPANKTNVTLIGESRDETVISYHIYNCSGGFNGLCPAEDAMLWSGDLIRTAATMTIDGDGFRAENLTIANTAGPTGQAQAITVRADKVIFRNCNLTGYQDTIYLWSDAKRSYFENCLVTGRTDYIYGSGTAYFQECEIRSWGGGWITAPSTGLDQPHGYVFNTCDITYALESPRAGDDGALVALGRPWHNYPKVAWIYCEMTEKIHPQGWPDIWNMDYAPTSEDLHLYEYQNTGPGADMSNRADWVGIRALTEEEVDNYTIAAVLSGNDNWDPTAVTPAAVTFDWTGQGATDSWLEAENWDPIGVPDTTEAAYVDGDTIVADGGYFAADLNLLEDALLLLTDSSDLNYLAVDHSRISNTQTVALTGRIRTKDSLEIIALETFALDAVLTGVHQISKTGEGLLALQAMNADFSGWWTVAQGSLQATASQSLGTARGIDVLPDATLIIESADAIFVNTPLRLQTGAEVVLHTDITLSELYIDGEIQQAGRYDATSNPGLISGSGSINIGRPDTFIFIGGSNGNWDVAEHFRPALLPEAGETVLCDIEMETTGTDFPADVTFSPGGRLRLRGVHQATGTLTFEESTSIDYATGSAGFSIEAPIVVAGDVLLRMNSRNMPFHRMQLRGPISGASKISAMNTRDDYINDGIAVLGGDNSGFTGIWDLTMAPGNIDSRIMIQGISSNALGHGLVEIANSNMLLLSHEQAAGDTLRVNLMDTGMIQLDVTVKVKHAVINGMPLAEGAYDANTHPMFFTGDGQLLVGISSSTTAPTREIMLYQANDRLIVKGQQSEVTIFSLNGQVALTATNTKTISLRTLPTGTYFAHYRIDGVQGVQKVVYAQ